MDPAQIENGLNAPLRMQLALDHVPVASGPVRHMLLTWLDHFLFAESDAEGRARLGASLSASRHELCWRATGPGAGRVSRLAALMESNGLPAWEGDLLREVVRRLPAADTGAWIRVTAASQDAGWHVDGDIDWLIARTWLPDNQAAAALQQWAQAQEVESCSRLARSAGESNPYLALRLRLSASDTEAQLLQAVAFFDQMSVPLPPRATLAGLLHAGRGPLQLSVWLSPRGLVQLGILAEQVPVAWLIEMCAASGVTDFEPLAAFQGVLGAEAPAAVATRHLANRSDVLMHYTL